MGSKQKDISTSPQAARRNKRMLQHERLEEKYSEEDATSTRQKGPQGKDYNMFSVSVDKGNDDYALLALSTKEESLNSLLGPPEIHIGSTGNPVSRLHHLHNYSGHNPFVGTDDVSAGELVGGIIHIGRTGPCGEHLVRQDPVLHVVRVVKGSWLACKAVNEVGDMAHQQNLGLECAVTNGGAGMLRPPQPWADQG